MKRSPLRKFGKSSRSRDRALWHRELKSEWATKGIYRCEQCNGTFGLALAHSLKRRFITTKDEYFTVALLCQSCHETIEHSGHDNMKLAIENIIANRSN